MLFINFGSFRMMHYKTLTAALLAALSLSSCTAQKGSAKRATPGDRYARVLEATSQRTLPGMRSQQPYTDYRIVLVWEKSAPPITFYWKPADGWHDARVTRYSPNPDSEQPISLQDVRKGDTLRIWSTTSTAKSPVPADIPESATNTLFFRTAASGWLFTPVRSINALEDIAMP
jgi:hypothetical protein